MTKPLDELLVHRKEFPAFVKRRVSDDGLAEDIVQTAYLRAFEHHDDFDPGESAVSWFYRLLRDAAIDNCRHRSVKDKALEALACEMEITPTREQELDICSCLQRVLNDPKPDYAESIRAIDLEDQPVQDFAARNGISASDASVRVHLARAALRNNLLRTCSSCAEKGCLNCTCKKSKQTQA
ncbi:sigma-70 family RNA polymerase sigma factor [Silvibacterium acidisoli]|uniref:sigma-70 family RNA polymerase sigma factor n=1 Tax=Acidobacteriaceae bacterium ZG23-2 TaxID=2883246 RepID=UPI00406C0A3C